MAIPARFPAARAGEAVATVTDPCGARFEAQDGVLRVFGDMDADTETRFAEELLRLIAGALAPAGGAAGIEVAEVRRSGRRPALTTSGKSGARSAAGEKGGPRVIVDLSAVRYMSSVYVMRVATAAIEAKQKGVRVIIRASRRVARVLRMGGLDKLGTIEVVGGA